MKNVFVPPNKNECMRMLLYRPSTSDFASFDLTKLPVSAILFLICTNTHISKAKWVTKPLVLSTQCYLRYLRSTRAMKEKKETQTQIQQKASSCSSMAAQQQQNSSHRFPRHSLRNEQNLALAPQTCILTLITHMCHCVRVCVCVLFGAFAHICIRFVFSAIRLVL